MNNRGVEMLLTVAVLVVFVVVVLYINLGPWIERTLSTIGSSI